MNPEMGGDGMNFHLDSSPMDDELSNSFDCLKPAAPQFLMMENACGRLRQITLAANK